MKKVLTGITAVCVFGLGMIGCDLNPLSTDKDEVSIDLVDIPSIPVGSTQNVSAKIDANVAISSIDITISDSSGEDVTDDYFTFYRSNFVFGDEKKIEIGEDMTMSITPLQTCCSGKYIFKMTATAGSVNTTKIDTFTVSGGLDCGSAVEDQLNEITVTLGNQDAAEGSALDIDEMVVYKSNQFTANTTVQGEIDAWFGVVNGKATMLAPSVANGFAPKTQNWSVQNATQFIKVTANFDNITVQSEIDALWSGTASTSVNVAAGDVFVVKTVGPNYRLLMIESASSALTGNVMVVGKIK